MSTIINAARIWAMVAESTMQNTIESARVGETDQAINWAEESQRAHMEIRGIQSRTGSQDPQLWEYLHKADVHATTAAMEVLEHLEIGSRVGV